MELVVVEGVEGTWHYHFAEAGKETKGLCERSTMRTEIPISAWGHRGDLCERWCRSCELLRDAYATITKKNEQLEDAEDALGELYRATERGHRSHAVLDARATAAAYFREYRNCSVPGT